MRTLFLVFFMLLSGCGTTPIATDYKGPSAGTVVVGLGTRLSSSYERYTLLIRKADASATKPTEVGFLSYRARGMFGGEKVDYQTDDEKGVILVASLPEGEYVLFNFNMFLNMGMGDVPFVVERSRMTAPIW